MLANLSKNLHKKFWIISFMSEGLNKVMKIGSTVLIGAATLTGKGCVPPSPINSPDKPVLGNLTQTTAESLVSVNPASEPTATSVIAQESRYIEPHQATQEDKQVFLTTLEKYINLDAEPKLKAQLDNPLFDKQFKVVVVDKPIHPLPAHTAYTFGNVQLSVVKDTKGQVVEENLLVGQVAKESLKIQPPKWEPIQPVNLNGKITSLGITAEFSPSAGNYLRYQKFNNGQLSIAWRNTPFPK